MIRSILTVVTAGALVLGVTANVAYAADNLNYGPNLMTEQERAEHRERMRSMQTEEQRNEYRNQMHEQMKKRAEKHGMTLPDAPRQGGRNQPYPGGGYGPGPGSGSGIGAGGGRGR